MADLTVKDAYSYAKSKFGILYTLLKAFLSHQHMSWNCIIALNCNQKIERKFSGMGIGHASQTLFMWEDISSRYM